LTSLLHFEPDPDGDFLPDWGRLENAEPAHGENGIFIEVGKTGTGNHPDIGDGAGGGNYKFDPHATPDRSR